MKKNKNNRKRKWKTLARLALIQVCIVLFYVLLCTTSHPYQKESCVSRQIVVDNIQYVRVYGEPRCRVTSDGVFYEFPGLGIFDEFSGREIYEQLHLGDTLDILYVKERSLFRCYNLIVDAKDATTTYLRLDAYNSEIAHASIAVHIIFLIIELLYIGGCMWWYMMFHRKRAFYKDPKKEYIKKFRPYPPFLYHRLDAWLAKMSRNGWHVVHCAGFFFWFEKGIPEEKEYFTYGMAAQEGMYSIELRYPSLEKTYGVPRRASKINANEAKSYHIVEIDRNMIDTSKHVGYRELIYDRNRLYRRYFIRILIALVACISILVALSLFLP